MVNAVLSDNATHFDRLEPPAASVRGSNARHRLGMILEKRRDTAGALREYEAAARLDPRLEGAKAAVERLQAGRKGS